MGAAREPVALRTRSDESNFARSLETLGRVRLSHSFFMRDFLHSEIADFYGVPNIPEDPDLPIAAGRRLCAHDPQAAGRSASRGSR